MWVQSLAYYNYVWGYFWLSQLGKRVLLATRVILVNIPQYIVIVGRGLNPHHQRQCRILNPLHRSRNPQRHLLLTTLTRVLKVLASEVRQEKEIKGIRTRKEDVFAVDMTVHVENCQEIYKNILKLIRGFSKDTGDKVNIQKSIGEFPPWRSG